MPWYTGHELGGNEVHSITKNERVKKKLQYVDKYGHFWLEVFDKQKPLVSEEYTPPTKRKFPNVAAVSVGSYTRNQIFGYLESDNKQSNFSFFCQIFTIILMNFQFLKNIKSGGSERAFFR